ncbi:hypothetical protein MAMT_01238 [Methylacidimicrobium tartarophylax]|uniref:Class I SAM-dependent methyltransferase n=2 Tax=Methylacidimicrobium tartarophylax TaxID=1041768 RepID=A0A5E6MKB6_9BACT|nr:hypothetical protein MAMT_01238 [Methylacidimicrobium tartarophylax]
MHGIDVDLDQQAESLRLICLPFQKEYQGNETYRQAVSRGFGPGYGYIEAQALHGVIRYLQPRRVIEVGSGTSTYCTREAARRNEAEGGARTEITAIEPFPSAPLRAMEEVRVIRSKVQETGVETFDCLREKDVLFIDSSHAVKPGGDVNFLILEVLPRLREGVVVHFHDIYFPYDYSRVLLKSFFPGTESSLLQAFLIFNKRFKILFCLSQLHYGRPEVLAEVFPEYRPQGGKDGLVEDRLAPFETPAGHFPSSIYLQVQPGQ